MIQQALFEHRFWLQILGDHARFIFNALSPKETKEIEMAHQFITQFDQLLHLARRPDAPTRINDLNKQAYELTMNLRGFKLSLLDQMLVGKIKMGLVPTFINHMVNELEEYLKILVSLLEGKPVPIYVPLHHHLLWLPDAAGHAASIAMELDAVEKRLIKRSEQFEQHFNAFYLKAIELSGYTRTMRTTFPALSRFHSDVNLEMSIFMSFLLELETIDLSAELLSRLNPLVPDHMYREECYYLLKLSQSGASVTVMECDPTKPRVEAK
ncbi:DUF2935 domain-containing protein [Paenibacillus sp. Soil750]|uniref:DUF2935 domain-containing protein n=1 Tax=Paenibacillus sp. Soil750 TaxID=1736398 RepID=UPI0006F417D5|nr:DUF2935 domain-containing protein [Paenibacillus sp. Soil750]KRE57816.1 hypothetical protein ASL11_29715 [Paenibacillus sp. Soil750]